MGGGAARISAHSNPTVPRAPLNHGQVLATAMAGGGGVKVTLNQDLTQRKS